ncbi:MAG TPA: transglutaminase family protein [Ramlibacter sp.]|uniref:transglutaminase-like domain-containing protein n=1 Tax=Ramlibacter sp. TaxID=1917967 RepID=UPI002CF9FD4E|nr:transglutaminase family protein [Ramlibacter sp.]HVZ45702.1 transglutaminase family protein [Ramlibacter sp.]
MANSLDAAPAARAAPIRLRYKADLLYEVRSDVCDFIFNVQATRTEQQRVVSETLGIAPEQPVHAYTDPATHARYFRLRTRPGALQVSCEAVVDLTHRRAAASSLGEVPISELPASVLPYLYPSRYCESDRLHRFAFAEFGALRQGYERVLVIRDWVRRHVAFLSNSSDGNTSACDTLVTKQGVCRDFAHLMIALCRAVNIPSRFATGIDYGADPALGPPDFHAYVEVYVGGAWYLFDPSGTAIPMGFIRLATGRDAADAAFASIFGSVEWKTPVIEIEAIAGADGVRRIPEHCEDALSTDAGPADA